MPIPTCTFVLENDSVLEMVLYLEPEGQNVAVAPGKVIEVRFFGRDRPVAVRCSVDAEGRQVISFWPEQGAYQLLLDGQDAYDLAIMGRNRPSEA